MRRVRNCERVLQFCSTLDEWIKAGIGTVSALSVMSGYSKAMINLYRKKAFVPSDAVVNDLLTSMGVIEQRYIEQWRAK